MVGNGVLIANVAKNIVKYFGIFGFKPWLVEPSAGQTSKSTHFIVGLQIIHLADWNTQAVRSCTTGRFRPLAGHPTNADGINRNVLGGSNFLSDLVQIDLAETVEPGADQDDVLVAFNPLYAVEGVIHSVENVSFGEPGDAQLVNRAKHRALVLGEIHQNLRLDVKELDCNPIFLFKLRRE